MTAGYLTFQELRLASLYYLRTEAEAPPLPPGMQLPDLPTPASLAPALAEMVIQIDRLAASKNIDLAVAIYDKLKPPPPPLPLPVQEEEEERGNPT